MFGLSTHEARRATRMVFFAARDRRHLSRNGRVQGMYLSWCPVHAHAVKRSTYIMSQVMANVGLSAFSCRAIETWNKFNGKSENLSRQNITRLFASMGYSPSESQVHEIWQFIDTCHTPFSFGIFYTCLSEMKYAHEKRLPRIQPLSKIDSGKQLMKRRSESVESSYDVFLGGSCNPTTWRTDVAIPRLKKFGISYYNPQVAQWVPELIDRENQAKESAKVMFFVIDNQTRSVACMIEAAHVAGTNRKLVLILNDPAEPGSLILGEPISEKEHTDLKQGRECLKDIVEMREITVFRDIHEALDETRRWFKGDSEPLQMATSRKAMGISTPSVTFADKCNKVKNAFDNYSSGNGEILLRDVKVIFRALTRKELPQECLDALARRAQGPVTNGIKEDVDNLRIGFDQFCIIYSDLKHKSNGFTWLNPVWQWMESFFRSFMSPEKPMAPNGMVPLDCAHIYLGGAIKGCTWREDIAIPILKKRGLKYYKPLRAPWDERFIPLEDYYIRNSKVLLFVITKTDRCLREMLVAAHYVGLGCKVILCIENLGDGIVVDGEQLTDLAIKDYNRGRMYLSDLANRSGVPVHHSILEAVTDAADRAAECKTCI